MNAKLALCVIALVVGVQSFPYPASDNTELALVESPLSLIAWIENIAQHLQQVVNTNFQEWISAVRDVGNSANIALQELENSAVAPATDNRNLSSCIAEHVARLVVIAQNGRDDVERCIQTGISQTIELRDAIQERLDEITVHAAGIKDVVNECKQGDNVPQCIFDNLKTILDAVKTIATETLALLVGAAAQSVQIVLESKACVNGSIDRVNQQQADSHTQLRQCLANGIVL